MWEKFSLPFLAFLQSTGLIVYVGLVVLFFNLMESKSFYLDNFYAPLLMLLIFIISAVISASLVLGRVGYLFWEKRYPESLKLLGWTIGWTLFYLTFLISSIII